MGYVRKFEGFVSICELRLTTVRCSYRIASKATEAEIKMAHEQSMTREIALKPENGHVVGENVTSFSAL